MHQSPTISNGVPRNELAPENRTLKREPKLSPAMRGGICIQTQTALTPRVSAGPFATCLRSLKSSNQIPTIRLKEAGLRNNARMSPHVDMHNFASFTIHDLRFGYVLRGCVVACCAQWHDPAHMWVELKSWRHGSPHMGFPEEQSPLHGQILI